MGGNPTSTVFLLRKDEGALPPPRVVLAYGPLQESVGAPSAPTQAAGGGQCCHLGHPTVLKSQWAPPVKRVPLSLFLPTFPSVPAGGAEPPRVPTLSPALEEAGGLGRRGASHPAPLNPGSACRSHGSSRCVCHVSTTQGGCGRRGCQPPGSPSPGFTGNPPPDIPAARDPCRPSRKQRRASSPAQATMVRPMVSPVY